MADREHQLNIGVIEERWPKQVPLELCTDSPMWKARNVAWWSTVEDEERLYFNRFRLNKKAEAIDTDFFVYVAPRLLLRQRQMIVELLR